MCLTKGNDRRNARTSSISCASSTFKWTTSSRPSRACTSPPCFFLNIHTLRSAYIRTLTILLLLLLRLLAGTLGAEPRAIAPRNHKDHFRARNLFQEFCGGRSDSCCNCSTSHTSGLFRHPGKKIQIITSTSYVFFACKIAQAAALYLLYNKFPIWRRQGSHNFGLCRK